MKFKIESPENIQKYITLSKYEPNTKSVKMSSAETNLPAAEEKLPLSEPPKTEQNGIALTPEDPAPLPETQTVAAPVTKDQNAPVQSAESAPLIETEAPPVKELIAEAPSAIIAEKEAVCNIEAKPIVEVSAEETSKIAAKEENELKDIDIGKPQSVGAGDSSLVVETTVKNEELKLETTAPAPQKTEDGITVALIVNETDQTAKAPTAVPEIENKTPQVDKPLDSTQADALTISKLKHIVLKTTEEKDSYKRKLNIAEKRLAALQSSYDAIVKGGGDENTLQRMVEELRNKLIQTSLQLEDRMRLVTNQEKQINALNSQVASLKEVESLTRSLLQIRNMEVKHLQTEVDDMEVRINEERQRYNTMINKMDSAVQLNADLKKEYETQLCLFRDLREKYEEKVSLLSAEKQVLEATAQEVTNGQ